MPHQSSVSVALVGSGGAGVMTAGNMLLEAAAHAGYYAIMTRSSGPQIRGGEAAAMIRIARDPIECMTDNFDVLAAVDWENVQRFGAEIPLAPGSFIVSDPDQAEPPEVFTRSGAAAVHVSLKKMAKAIPDGRANMLLLGFVAAMIGLPDEAVSQAVEKALAKRPAALAPSLAAVAAGRHASRTCPPCGQLEPAPPRATQRWLITGNEAAGYGAIKGGVRFVAAYPITPATELLEWMSPALAEVGGTLVQAEDELASINMAIGGSYGGVPSLTATSGPGLALMVESLGLAVASETPVVVVDVMRVGPSTGIPTKSEQGDLNIALYGLHGDAPHLVLAPNSVADCLFTTEWAVRLAEALQAPAIVLSDQFLGQTRAVIDRPADRPGDRPGPRLVAEANQPGYKRYSLTPDGVSPMAIPGTPGVAYTADGLEHGERGTPSSQGVDHLAQLDKRQRKLDHFEYGAGWADVEGDGDLAVITFGSCTGVLREALARARSDGIGARLVSLRLLSPAQPSRLAAALDGVRRVIVIEQNHTGQFFRHLRAEYDPARRGHVAAPPGRPAVQPGRDSSPARRMESNVTGMLSHTDFKSDIKPVWCPGCGDFGVVNALTKALAKMELRPEDVAVVSGIGCSSRIPAYTSCYGFHGVHGRALAAGTGLKVARPDLTVIVTGGDGDGYSIGGNHFLHACRRNVDMTYIVMDNRVYGMTKGQPSPTTEPEWDSKLAPEGTGLREFRPMVLALSTGANFIARAFTGDPNGLADIIVQAVRHPGFSFIEVLSPCVTFRPEQRDWKKIVKHDALKPTSDLPRAVRRMLRDTGFDLGVLYAGDRKPYERRGRREARDVSALEARFEL